MKQQRGYLTGAIGLMTLLVGCGGAGSGSTVVLDAKQQVRALAISTTDSQVATNKLIVTFLGLTAPSGSPLSGLSAVTGFGRVRKATPAYDPDLHLYYALSYTGATLTVSFYQDLAETQPVGTATATIRSAASFSNVYAVYPATVDVTFSITGGTLPASGSASIVILDGNGKNTVSGQFRLPSQGTSVSFNATSDGTSVTGGNITVSQSGLTITMQPLAGTVQNGITGPVSVEPYGLNGTATLQLVQGNSTMTLNGPVGLTATVSIGTDHSLLVAYGDGSSLKMSNVLSQSVVGPGTGNFLLP